MNEGDHTDMELYALLGLMVRTAAELELRLQIVARDLCESPYTAFWINGENTSKVRNLIEGVARVRADVTPQELDVLKDLMKRCSAAFDRRNAYVHGAWLMDASDPDASAKQTLRFTRGNEAPRFAPLSISDLNDLVQDLSAVMTDLMGWWEPRLTRSHEKSTASP
ncbi:hypothetical protein ABZ883_04805 [Streptomyces sp. NPDC046977]|uniref:hypothetical protein n=1 Tax=Streptomyces sp. NPDC046977 TaxID=3154703 RepID=UPI0033CCB7E3